VETSWRRCSPVALWRSCLSTHLSALRLPFPPSPGFSCQVCCCLHSGVSGMPPDVFLLWLSHTRAHTNTFRLWCAWSGEKWTSSFDSSLKSVSGLCARIATRRTLHIFLCFHAFSSRSDESPTDSARADPFLSLHFRVRGEKSVVCAALQGCLSMKFIWASTPDLSAITQACVVLSHTHTHTHTQRQTRCIQAPHWNTNGTKKLDPPLLLYSSLSGEVLFSRLTFLVFILSSNWLVSQPRNHKLDETAVAQASGMQIQCDNQRLTCYCKDFGSFASWFKDRNPLLFLTYINK